MPAPGNVYPCAILLRVGVPDDVSVFSMAALSEEGVVAAPLLPHIVEDKVCRPVIDACSDGEYRRANLSIGCANGDFVRSLFLERTEIQAISLFHPAKWPGSDSFAFENGLPCINIRNQEAFDRILRCCHHYCDLRRFREITNLVDSDNRSCSCADSDENSS